MNFSALKPLVYDNQKYTALQDYVEHKIQIEYKNLETATDPIQIYQIQGRIFALRKLQHLREEVVQKEIE